ncbi:aromatic-L-amino-acid decarboxylase-like isoform X1 [Octopus sinensis]|uniref:Aromatic-L-amino-acid decarboxylase n=1 Tax=Octopus sinensis TaxID=2607531 RepID=A0A7E6EML2_9MOLL|nr:aromatic-L-amino-acid decarboxylase-like isoform X1 [Octopus sinensis]XP_036356877.1 aromatic-L-amino-acid decarboxylase-like isoform X1 [Octopus sinensis]
MENAEDFEAAAVELAKYIVDYFHNIRSRKVLPVCAPGFLRIMITDKAPEYAHPWKDVFDDIERVIMSGICHWQHPRFASFFPSRTSYAAILGGMFSNALATDVISWKSFPVATELEVIVLDWLAKALKLPKFFLSTSEGDGGGVIQNSSTECMLLSLFAARTASIKKIKTENNEMEDAIAVTKLIAYKSEETHASFAKACKIVLVKCRNIKMDDKRSMRGDNLKKAIEEDRAKGRVPFYVCSTLGTTSLCAFDNINELGAVCKDEGLWLHIDAAYAGNAFICPEYRYLMNGVEYADSICVSPHKWLQVPTGCSVLWLKNSNKLVNSLPEPGEYLQCTEEDSEMPNFTKWQIPCGRPFISLKLWFVFRLFGIRELQKIIRKDIKLAQIFRDLIEKDGRFELIGENLMSLVCFRLKGNNEINEELIQSLTLTREIHIGCSKIDDNVFLRFVVHAYQATSEDIQYSYKLIKKLADQVLFSKPHPRSEISSKCFKCIII